MPGYNTLQEARALETKAARFSPDAVVVLYVINDPYPDLAISHHITGHLKFEHLLYGGIRRLLERLGWGDRVKAELGQLYDDPRAWNVVVSGFDRLQTFSAAHRVPVVVAIFPMFLERNSPSLAPIYRRVAAEAVRHGFTAIDLSQTAYKDVPVSTLLKPSGDSIHPNAHAHELAASSHCRCVVAMKPFGGIGNMLAISAFSLAIGGIFGYLLSHTPPPPATMNHAAGPAELAILAPLREGSQLAGFEIKTIEAVHDNALSLLCTRGNETVRLDITLGGSDPAATAGRYRIFYSRGDGRLLAKALAEILTTHLADAVPSGLSE